MNQDPNEKRYLYASQTTEHDIDADLNDDKHTRSMQIIVDDDEEYFSQNESP
jgi:hypothetical protein